MKSFAREWLPFPVSTMDDTNVTIVYELLVTGSEIMCPGMVIISCLNNGRYTCNNSIRTPRYRKLYNVPQNDYHILSQQWRKQSQQIRCSGMVAISCLLKWRIQMQQ